MFRDTLKHVSGDEIVRCAEDEVFANGDYSEPLENFLDEVEIAFCPTEERIDALADTKVSDAVRTLCRAEIAAYEEGREQ